MRVSEDSLALSQQTTDRRDSATAQGAARDRLQAAILTAGTVRDKQFAFMFLLV